MKGLRAKDAENSGSEKSIVRFKLHPQENRSLPVSDSAIGPLDNRPLYHTDKFFTAKPPGKPF